MTREVIRKTVKIDEMRTQQSHSEIIQICSKIPKHTEHLSRKYELFENPKN